MDKAEGFCEHLLWFRQNLRQVSLLWFENFAPYAMDQYFDMVEVA